jgi:hypothetical protein
MSEALFHRKVNEYVDNGMTWADAIVAVCKEQDRT